MADSIILSSSVRNNLLSLQNTARLLATTQNHLATGLKVNSALDDPSAFFTASSLNSRANDLNRLLDDVGLAVQTLEAADKGIGAITDLVEAAQAAARNALQASGPTASAAAVTGSGASITADAAATISGATDINIADVTTLGGVTNGDSFSVNGTTITISTGDSGTDIATAINAISGVSATLNATTGYLEITADDADTAIVIADVTGTPTGATGLNIATGTVNGTNLISQSAVAQGETLTITVGSNAAQTITFGTGAGEVSTLAELQAAVTALGGSNGIATGAAVDADGNLSVTATSNADSIVIGGTATVANFGVTAGTTAPTAGGTPNATRTAAEAQFNNLLTQINDLAADSSFNGNNLLTGDDLTVIFNEDGSSSLAIAGVTFTSTGLGISAVTTGDFQTNANIDTTLAELDTAIASLRTQAATFGSNLSVVQIRQDFTRQLIDVLETGAGNLTLADTNREGANLLALQTRQQLSSTSLGIAARADQAVLQLLR
jgi:flagellin-like hook-associated protein FlgL